VVSPLGANSSFRDREPVSPALFQENRSLWLHAIFNWIPEPLLRSAMSELQIADLLWTCHRRKKEVRSVTRGAGCQLR
jgi:hypothetical protein